MIAAASMTYDVIGMIGTALVMAANILLGYLYRMSAPEDIAAAQDQDADDEIEEATRAQQRAYLEANIDTLAAPMFARSLARFKMRNGLQMTDSDYAALEGVIDDTITPALPAGNHVTSWDYMRHFSAARRGGACQIYVP